MGPITHTWGGGKCSHWCYRINTQFTQWTMYYYSKHIKVQHTGKVILVMARKN